MWRWLRRLFGLALLAGGVYAAYTAWQRRTEPVPAGPAEWPPLDDAPAATAPVSSPPAAEPEPVVADTSTAPPSDTSASAPTWLAPVDGQCPDGYPIKANKSGIYHVPGGRVYARTVPERCYVDEASADADGYRRSKV